MSVEIVIRFIGGILAGTTIFQILTNYADLSRFSVFEIWLVYGACSLAFLMGYLATPYLTTRPFFWLRYRIYHATASDVVATIYHGLGITPDLEIRDRLDRPMLLLPEGAPIRDLFA